jgi:V8-like Glu-specific endopeptidase
VSTPLSLTFPETRLPAPGGCGDCPCRTARQQSGREYVVIGTDERTRVLLTTAAPFRYICNLEYGGWSVGTGTLVGPRTVLTAGHCIHEFRGGAEVPIVPSRLRVVPGRNGALEPLAATRAVRVIAFPGYRRGTRTDLGIIQLANPVGRTVGWWRQVRVTASIDPIGTSMSPALPQPAGVLRVNISGYPADMPLDRRWGCRRPSGRPCEHSTPGDPSRDRVRCGTEQWKSYDRTLSLAVPGILSYLDDTCPGHSGSPVWVRRDPSMGGRTLIGVHIAGGPGGASNRAVQLTRANLQWIRSNTV